MRCGATTRSVDGDAAGQSFQLPWRGLMARPGERTRGPLRDAHPRARPTTRDSLRSTRTTVGHAPASETRARCASTRVRCRWAGEFQVTSAPVVVRDTVIVGSAIGDNQRVDAPSGRVRAFDARTGALRWTWDPLRPDASGRTPRAGAANVWAPMAMDEARGLVFLPTSSPSPDFFGGERPGDNRDADSVVALRVADGSRAWAFQVVKHDVWDYDVAAQPTLGHIARRRPPTRRGGRGDQARARVRAGPRHGPAGVPGGRAGGAAGRRAGRRAVRHPDLSGRHAGAGALGAQDAGCLRIHLLRSGGLPRPHRRAAQRRALHAAEHAGHGCLSLHRRRRELGRRGDRSERRRLREHQPLRPRRHADPARGLRRREGCRARQGDQSANGRALRHAARTGRLALRRDRATLPLGHARCARPAHAQRSVGKCRWAPPKKRCRSASP